MNKNLEIFKTILADEVLENAKHYTEVQKSVCELLPADAHADFNTRVEETLSKVKDKIDAEGDLSHIALSVIKSLYLNMSKGNNNAANDTDPYTSNANTTEGLQGNAAKGTTKKSKNTSLPIAADTASILGKEAKENLAEKLRQKMLATQKALKNTKVDSVLIGLAANHYNDKEGKLTKTDITKIKTNIEEAKKSNLLSEEQLNHNDEILKSLSEDKVYKAFKKEVLASRIIGYSISGDAKTKNLKSDAAAQYLISKGLTKLKGSIPGTGIEFGGAKAVSSGAKNGVAGSATVPVYISKLIGGKRYLEEGSYLITVDEITAEEAKKLYGSSYQTIRIKTDEYYYVIGEITDEATNTKTKVVKKRAISIPVEVLFTKRKPEFEDALGAVGSRVKVFTEEITESDTNKVLDTITGLANMGQDATQFEVFGDLYKQISDEVGKAKQEVTGAVEDVNENA